MKKLIFFTAVFLLQESVQAADGDFAVSKIPLSLLTGANAVVRIQDTKFEIISMKETVLKEHYVITILNEKADYLADITEEYNKLYHIESIEGYLYDANGIELKRIKKKDVQDLSGVDDNSLIDDTRQKHHNFYYKGYPYTIEYSVETVYKTTFLFPSWLPQKGEGIAVEQSSLIVQYPSDYTVRYKAFNYKSEPISTEEKKERTLNWSVRLLPAIWRESYSPLWYELTTMVILGPSDFQMEDYKGNMLSWQDFGKFVYSLKAGRDELPDAVKQRIHSIADNIIDPKEKIAKLYEFMQNNTRYISIQLGIGGWQPFDAKEVAAKGYGDCKALSNYMYSILKEEGIPSYYTLVHAGKYAGNITNDFPSQQFNHVILCVPLQKDTMWLECTNQTMQAGYLGDFTCDRPVLLIDENGGKLVHTPVYKMKDNVQVRNIKAALNEDGSLKVDANSHYSGLQQDYYHYIITSLSKDKQKEELHERLDFGTYEIISFDYVPEKKQIPVINETLEILVSNYATITGKRLFIVPNMMTRSGRKLNQDSSRKYDIQLGFGFRDIDTAEIQLPKGYTPESIPRDINLSSKFGNYSSSVKLDGDKLIYYRDMEHFGGRYPAASYSELVNFYETIYKADRSKVVLVKN